ncbi:MAG: hypothetical protein ACE5DY_08540 [Mariprofundaceae bacterium]
MLQKTMVVIEGVGRELEPTVNVWTLARPLVTKWVAEHMGPAAQVQQGVEDVREGVEGWLKLPGQVQQALAEQKKEVTLQQEPPSTGLRLLGMALLASGSAAITQLWTEPPEPMLMIASIIAILAGVRMLWRR